MRTAITTILFLFLAFAHAAAQPAVERTDLLVMANGVGAWTLDAVLARQKAA